MPTPDTQIAQRALVVTAHPDDVDFGAAGTIATWVAQGTAVTYCILTDGDAGGFDPAVPRSDIPRIRRAEQVAAARILGVDDVRFLGYRDGQLEVSQGLRRDISRVIRQVRPQRMLIQSPERNWARIPASHPDLLSDEGLDAWSVHDVWVMGGPTPNHVMDVTDVFSTKIAALRAHESQTAHMDDLEERIRGWMTMAAQNAGLPEGRLAEGFLRTEIP